jgi:hypothetical protein
MKKKIFFFSFTRQLLNWKANACENKLIIEGYNKLRTLLKRKVVFSENCTVPINH